MRVLWLPGVLRSAGLTVIEVPGWATRGRELTTIHGVVWHHTATGPTWTDQRVTDLLRDGRPDLPGPLSQLGLDRQGRYWIVAAGRANHNGYGTWGNDSIGIEAYNAGDGQDPWPTAQLDAYVAGTAAVLAHLGLPAARALAHRETDPRRKPDPVGIDMAVMRRRITTLLGPPAPHTPAGPSTQKEPEMTDDDRKLLAATHAEARAAGMRAQACEQHLARIEAQIERRYGSLRGWLAAIAAKVGVTRDDAIAHDPNHR